MTFVCSFLTNCIEMIRKFLVSWRLNSKIVVFHFNEVLEDQLHCACPLRGHLLDSLPLITARQMTSRF